MVIILISVLIVARDKLSEKSMADIGKRLRTHASALPNLQSQICSV